MIIQPHHLKKGDKIAIVCPAKKLPKPIDDAVSVLKSWRLEVILGKSVSAEANQFAGSDALRASDLQAFLDDPEIKAIFAGRGGYGTIRIIDDLNFDGFKANPKWLIGFSDITVLLNHVFAQHQVQSMHAQMPYTFEESTPEALLSLKKALFGERQSYSYTSSFKNKPGLCSGTLVGGNLTLLCMLQGSSSEVDFENKILFLEDVGEHEYAIDRMMRMLKRAGKLAKLRGLIIGAFNEIAAEQIPFGQTADEVIWALVRDYDYPVCFNFPSGHIENNMTMIVGAEVELKIAEHNVEFKYL